MRARLREGPGSWSETEANEERAEGSTDMTEEDKRRGGDICRKWDTADGRTATWKVVKSRS